MTRPAALHTIATARPRRLGAAEVRLRERLRSAGLGVAVTWDDLQKATGAGDARLWYALAGAVERGWCMRVEDDDRGPRFALLRRGDRR